MPDVEVEGRRVALSSPDRVLWPATGFTKGEMIAYYAAVAPALLPHLRDRPLTLKRYPEGVDRGFWFDKQCAHAPDWIPRTTVASRMIAGKTLNYCLVNDLPALVWAANHAAVELHPLLAAATDVERPTVVAFDLDPGAPAGMAEARAVAIDLRGLLDGLGLATWPKTSGGKGIHVFVPLNTPVGYDDTKRFARAVAALLAERHPDRVTDRMDKSRRPGKVFVDWSQNDPTKTTVVAYSLRAQRRPTVSTPLTWDEVEAGGDLAFGPDEVLARVEAHGDLFAPVLDVRQTLPE